VRAGSVFALFRLLKRLRIAHPRPLANACALRGRYATADIGTRIRTKENVSHRGADALFERRSSAVHAGAKF
jgi:hypothetical protein